jgi:hypothetical protein
MNKNSHTKFLAPEVCIITGGLINVTEKSMWKAAKKQLRQLKESRHQWLEIKIKTGQCRTNHLSQTPK